MTWVSGAAVTMTDEEFRLIRDMIYEICGIFLPESVKFLVERRLRPRLAVFGVATFRDYYRSVKYGRNQHSEFDEIVERITTNETYFFRGEAQLNALTDEILPLLTESRSPNDTIRIWSAGCSSGEEPYTLAMLMHEHPNASGYRFDIFGHDISRKVLRTAREAVYRESSFRQTEPTHIYRYFAKEAHTYRLKEEIRRYVTFGHLNLMDEAAMSLINDVDVVFCRNVMIYFAPESRRRLVEALYRRMRPGGFLLLGHAESLINVSTEFEIVALRNDIVYRKPLSPSFEGM